MTMAHTKAAEHRKAPVTEPHADRVSQPPVIVNGFAISPKLVAAEAQNHTAPSDMPGMAWQRAANAIAVRTLLLQEAERRGLQPLPREFGGRRMETDEEALIRMLLEVAVNAVPPDDAAVYGEWARDPSRFRAPPLWEVSHCLVACDPREPAAREAAYQRAADLAREACANPGKFAHLAQNHSDCGSRVHGGSLGQLGPGDTMPEFEAALRRLEDGEIAPEPILTKYGWHIVRMDAKAQGAILPFEAVRRKLALAMEKAEWARAARRFVVGLAASAEITGADLS